MDAFYWVAVYRVVAYIGVSSGPYRKSREGVAITLLFGGRVTKIHQEDEG